MIRVFVRRHHLFSHILDLFFFFFILFLVPGWFLSLLMHLVELDFRVFCGVKLNLIERDLRFPDQFDEQCLVVVGPRLHPALLELELLERNAVLEVFGNQF